MKKLLFCLQVLAGIALICAGSFIFTSDSMKNISGLCMGFGASLSALGIGWLIQSSIAPSLESEDIKKFKKIEVNDERNTAIREKAGYMVAKIMNYVLLVFVLALTFMKINTLIMIFAVSLIIIEFALWIIFSNYFAKRM